MEQIKAIEQIIKEQVERVQRLKAGAKATDFSKLDKVIIGTVSGDGIGPVIMDSCTAILKKLLSDEIASGKIELRPIEGLTLETGSQKWKLSLRMYWQPSKNVTSC